MIQKIIYRIFSYFNLYSISPPYEYVQNVTMRHLGNYIKKENSQIKNICIVGGYDGREISTLLSFYPKANINVYECSNRYKDLLDKKFKTNKRVSVHKKAVSNSIGQITFYETNLKGAGSLLEVGNLSETSYNAQNAEKFIVESTTLDIDFPTENFDCLWIDVQGAELMVLEGAKELLNRTDSIFIEVSILPNLYKDAVVMKDLSNFLSKYSFELTLLGLDKNNLTGNALYSKIKSK